MQSATLRMVRQLQGNGYDVWELSNGILSRGTNVQGHDLGPGSEPENVVT